MKQRMLWNAVLGIVLSTAVFSGMYFLAQQTQRLAMNDPQIEMVDTLGFALATGEKGPELIPKQRVVIDSQKAPWINVYGKDQKPLYGNGYLGSVLAQVPPGVMQQPGSGITNRVTWQPLPKIRVALVVYTTQTPDGVLYVVSGRNMSEGEARIDVLGSLLLLLWGMTSASLLVLLLLKERFARH